MKKRDKMRRFVQGLGQIIARNPAEACLALAFFVLWASLGHRWEPSVRSVLQYGPVVFLCACLLHRKARGRLRAFYYASPLLLVPFWWANESLPLRYAFTLAAVQLLYVLSFGRKKDAGFMYSLLDYARTVGITVFLSSVTWCMLLLLSFSIRYIFDIWQDAFDRILLYTQAFSYGLLAPLFFLRFSDMREETEEDLGSFPFFLLNSILSLALLVYSGILYLYIIRIALTANLPKGQVAYLVTGFAGLLFLLKGCQPFVRRRHYDWFYRHASLVSLPTLALCWTGIWYRVSQYGFTVPRVYLVIVVLLLTLLSLSFFFRKIFHYHAVAWAAAVIIIGMSYVPGISVRDIEAFSQERRLPASPSGRPHADRLITIESTEAVDVSSYRKAWLISQYGNEGNYFLSARDSLTIYIQDKPVLKESYSRLLDIQLAKAGINSSDSIPEKEYAGLLEYAADSATVVFEQLIIRHKDTTFRLTYACPKCYLTK